MHEVWPIKLGTKDKTLKGLAVFLLGIFFLGFNIGTGSVTAMAKAGASYGTFLLWTTVASCLIIGVLPLTSSRD
ncbi:MAG: hypothetical protein OTI34_15180 [Lewinella sp.]|nr:hypothetical protein [Lewinella sp.]